jgi:hypothetical protein
MYSLGNLRGIAVTLNIFAASVILKIIVGGYGQ